VRSQAASDIGKLRVSNDEEVLNALLYAMKNDKNG
jgi:hypothetical protein